MTMTLISVAYFVIGLFITCYNHFIEWRISLYCWYMNRENCSLLRVGLLSCIATKPQYTALLSSYLLSIITQVLVKRKISVVVNKVIGGIEDLGKYWHSNPKKSIWIQNWGSWHTLMLITKNQIRRIRSTWPPIKWRRKHFCTTELRSNNTFPQVGEFAIPIWNDFIYHLDGCRTE